MTDDVIHEIAVDAVTIGDEVAAENESKTIAQSVKEIQEAAANMIEFLEGKDRQRQIWAKNDNVRSKRLYLISMMNQNKENSIPEFKQALGSYITSQLYNSGTEGDFTKNWLKIVKQMDDAINNIRGIEINLVYSMGNRQTGENSGVYKVKNELEVLEKNSQSQSLRFKSYNSISNIINKDKDKQSVLQNLTVAANNKNSLDKTYTEIVRRMNNSKKYVTKTSVALLLWKPDKVWKKLWVNTMGDINEAYAAFYLIPRCFTIFNENKLGSPWDSYQHNYVNEFVENKDAGILYVDAVGALFQADIEWQDDNGNSHGAHVKSSAASLPGYVQYVAFARQVQALGPSLTEEKITEFIKEERRNARNEAYSKGPRSVEIFPDENGRTKIRYLIYDAKTDTTQLVEKYITKVTNSMIKQALTESKKFTNTVIDDIMKF